MHIQTTKYFTNMSKNKQLEALFKMRDHLKLEDKSDHISHWCGPGLMWYMYAIKNEDKSFDFDFNGPINGKPRKYFHADENLSIGLVVKDIQYLWINAMAEFVTLKPQQEFLEMYQRKYEENERHIDD